MEVRIGFAEVDTQSTPDVRVGFIELDCLASIDVRCGFVEFDCQAPTDPGGGGDESLTAGPTTGGRGRTLKSVAAPKNFAPATPEPPASRYHDYEGDTRAAAELDDEETILVLLMEIYCDVV